MFKMIHRYWRGRFERFYFKNHWHFVLDLSLSLIIICLLIILSVLYLYRPDLPGFGYYARPPLYLNNPPLSLGFSPDINASGLSDGTTLKINFKNTGAAAISDLKIIIETADNNFSVERLENVNNDSGFSLNNQTILFSKIAPGASGEAAVKVYFNPKAEARIINWRARSEYSFAGQILKNYFDLAALKIIAEMNVKDAAYYTSPQGDQLGIGPLPPIVGIPTNYWIFWEAQSRADWNNFVVSARLPKGVSLTDSRSLLAGEFNYNPGTRQIIWKIPAFSGRAEGYRLGFEVQIIPTADQIGRVLPLLSNPQYYATDSLTGRDVNGILDNLTTDLNKDRFNSGQGKVAGE